MGNSAKFVITGVIGRAFSRDTEFDGSAEGLKGAISAFATRHASMEDFLTGSVSIHLKRESDGRTASVEIAPRGKDLFLHVSLSPPPSEDRRAFGRRLLALFRKEQVNTHQTYGCHCQKCEDDMITALGKALRETSLGRPEVEAPV